MRFDPITQKAVHSKWTWCSPLHSYTRQHYHYAYGPTIGSRIGAYFPPVTLRARSIDASATKLLRLLDSSFAARFSNRCSSAV
jgi:hypothetical protein